MRVSNSQLDDGKPDPLMVTSDEFRQAVSPANGLVVSDSGKRTVQLVRHGLRDTEGDFKRDVFGGPLLNSSLQPSYRSCIHCEVPLRSAHSVVFVDKALSISLSELELAAHPALYTSTLSVRLGVSSRCRYAADTKPSKTNGVYERHRATKWSGNKHSGQERGLGQCAGPRSKQQETNGKDKTCHSDTQRRSSILGFVSSRVPRPSNTKAGRQKGNADEAVFQRRRTFSPDPEFTTLSRRTVTDNTETPSCPTDPTKHSTPDTTCHHSRLKPDCIDETLSLKEALELFRPDFISRSQGRVRRLEQRARRRRVLQDTNQGPEQKDQSKQKPNCTTPDPLSDNLFKPRERSISGREMQLRSRRIYNKLPEVTKKKEEEKKRAVSQTNRLRAEVFKKRLLDQVLQR